MQLRNLSSYYTSPAPHKLYISGIRTATNTGGFKDIASIKQIYEPRFTKVRGGFIKKLRQLVRGNIKDLCSCLI